MNEEELTDTVLKYYGIPTLSMKSAVHRLLTEQPQLLDQLWWPDPDPKIHPTCIGARSADDLVTLGQGLAKLKKAVFTSACLEKFQMP